MTGAVTVLGHDPQAMQRRLRAQTPALARSASAPARPTRARARTDSTDSLSPVRKYQPGPAWWRSANAFKVSGLSRYESTLMEDITTWRPTRSPRYCLTFARLAVPTGEMPEQVVLTKLISTTLS